MGEFSMPLNNSRQFIFSTRHIAPGGRASERMGERKLFVSDRSLGWLGKATPTDPHAARLI